MTGDVGVLVGEYCGKLGAIQCIQCARRDDDRVGFTETQYAAGR